MDNAIYAAMTRQSGLMREMQVIANNIANAETTGFRREGVIFSEYLTATGNGSEGLSMAHARGRLLDLQQAGMTRTGGTYDLAIDGPGFFAVETPVGTKVTRAGAFFLSAEGEVMTADGNRLLDEGLAPILIPDPVTQVAIGPDGTVSAGGEQLARIGLFAAPDPEIMLRHGGTLFDAGDDLAPAVDARIQQGFLEDSNVDPIAEITRMIQVQRAYEIGQSLLDREDRRIRDTITAMTR
ncbi:flagellar hook-basal body complex protein [Paracoccus aerodenitrificans]|uniref:flagellar hook-basal body complex protein n=1 Tax=Paracoccus aerodenitrificans TaxID=3017781 RepID=UPI0022F0693E|nr:flagellar hook-basal body complex protein [Paracoccus aerodenitrificans]WBU63276.1 flagellar hook-basal body complex protein [Paracoccus aerodenitrificans]